MPEPFQVAREMVRVLRPGGQVAILTSYAGRPPVRHAMTAAPGDRAAHVRSTRVCRLVHVVGPRRRGAADPAHVAVRHRRQARVTVRPSSRNPRRPDARHRSPAARACDLNTCAAALGRCRTATNVQFRFGGETGPKQHVGSCHYWAQHLSTDGVALDHHVRRDRAVQCGSARLPTFRSVGRSAGGRFPSPSARSCPFVIARSKSASTLDIHRRFQVTNELAGRFPTPRAATMATRHD